MKNSLWPMESAMFLQTMDLPLIFSALTYGGLSVYLSLTNPSEPQKALPWLVAIPLVLLFAAACVMNFWIA